MKIRRRIETLTNMYRFLLFSKNYYIGYMKWAFSIKQQHCPTSIITMKGLNLTKRRAPPSCVKPIPEVVPELVKLVQRSGFMYSAFNIDKPVVVWFFPQKFWIKLEECAGALSFRHFPYNENPTRALNTNSRAYGTRKFIVAFTRALNTTSL